MNGTSLCRAKQDSPFTASSVITSAAAGLWKEAMTRRSQLSVLVILRSVLCDEEPALVDTPKSSPFVSLNMSDAEELTTDD